MRNVDGLFRIIWTSAHTNFGAGLSRIGAAPMIFETTVTHLGYFRVRLPSSKPKLI